VLLVKSWSSDQSAKGRGQAPFQLDPQAGGSSNVVCESVARPYIVAIKVRVHQFLFVLSD